MQVFSNAFVSNSLMAALRPNIYQLGNKYNLMTIQYQLNMNIKRRDVCVDKSSKDVCITILTLFLSLSLSVCVYSKRSLFSGNARNCWRNPPAYQVFLIDYTNKKEKKV